MVGYKGYSGLKNVDIFDLLCLDPYKDYTKKDIDTRCRRISLHLHPDKLDNIPADRRPKYTQQDLSALMNARKDKGHERVWKRISKQGCNGWQSTWNFEGEGSHYSKPIPSYVERFPPSPPPPPPNSRQQTARGSERPMFLQHPSPPDAEVIDLTRSDDETDGDIIRLAERPMLLQHPIPPDADSTRSDDETDEDIIRLAKQLDSVGLPVATMASDDNSTELLVVAYWWKNDSMHMYIQPICLDGKTFEPADGLPCRAKMVAYKAVKQEGGWIGRFKHHHELGHLRLAACYWAHFRCLPPIGMVDL